jgi:hypothetical protein
VVSLVSKQCIDSTYDVQSDNLSAGLLDLLQLSEVVPVSGLGNNVVGSKNPHSANPSILLHVSNISILITRAWGSGPPPLGASPVHVLSPDILIHSQAQRTPETSEP